jgi:hypothetical protein
MECTAMIPGRILIMFGIVLVIVGLLVQFAPALRLGRLPGDLSFGNRNVRVYVPIGTSILLSLALTLLLSLVSGFARR